MRTRPTARWLAFGALLILAGCSQTGTPSSSSSAPASSDAAGTTNSAGNNPSSAQPSNSASTPAPTPAPSAPPAPPIVIQPGTVLTVTVDQTISTKENSAGDRFAASLAEPVTLDGNQVLPAGTKASGTVTQAQSAGHLKGGAVLALTLDSITLHGRKYSVEASPFEQEGQGRGKRTAVGAGGGAALGAIVGAIAGGGKGAAIGAVAGGGAGTAGSAFTGKRDITIAAETRLHFKLVKSLKIPA